MLRTAPNSSAGAKRNGFTDLRNDRMAGNAQPDDRDQFPDQEAPRDRRLHGRGGSMLVHERERRTSDPGRRFRDPGDDTGTRRDWA